MDGLKHGLNIIPPEKWDEYTDADKIGALTALTEGLGYRLNVALQILEEIMEGSSGTDEEWLEGKTIVHDLLTRLFEGLDVGKAETMQ